MLSCKQASHIISQSLDRNLTWRERFNLRLHLIICKYCARFRQQLFAMRLAIRRLSESIENDTSIHLPSETKARIFKALEAE